MNGVVGTADGQLPVVPPLSLSDVDPVHAVIVGTGTLTDEIPVSVALGARREHRDLDVAVAVGFEPTVGLHPHTLSRRAP